MDINKDLSIQEKNEKALEKLLVEGENLLEQGIITQEEFDSINVQVNQCIEKKEQGNVEKIEESTIVDQNSNSVKVDSFKHDKIDKDTLILISKIKRYSITTTVFWAIVILLAVLVLGGALLDTCPILYSSYFTIPLYTLLPIAILLQSRYTYLKKQGSKMSLQKKGFNFSKELIIGKYTFMIDAKNKSWCIMTKSSLSKIYKFSDIISYEIYEDGKSVVKGSVGRALIGGAFFGVTGAIIGSSGKRTVSNYCSSLKLLVRINDINNPQIEITFINSQQEKDSSTYRNCIKSIQEISSCFEYMINNKTLEESTSIEKSQKESKSKREQLLELKELLEEGLITEDDFNKKKQEIL